MGMKLFGGSAGRSQNNYRDCENSNYRDCEYDGTSPRPADAGRVSIQRPIQPVTPVLREIKKKPTPVVPRPVKPTPLTTMDKIHMEEDAKIMQQITQAMAELDTTPEPNKMCFTIFSIQEGPKYDLVMVRYKHCTTFGGLKVLLVKKGSVSYDMRELDPHFFEKGIVVGRFAPTNEGIGLARGLMK